MDSSTTLDHSSSAPVAQPPIATEYATLDALLQADAVRPGMEKDELIDVLSARPESELMEVTLHAAGLTLLIAPPSQAVPATAGLSFAAHAPMIFGLHDDQLVVALEIREDLADVIAAIDEKAGEVYGARSSFPPSELREWASASNYFNDDNLSLYLNVEDSIARNFWHESDLNASFRQPKGESDCFWFMLSRRPGAAPQQRTKPDRPISVIYGVIDPAALPDDVLATGDALRSIKEELSSSLRSVNDRLYYLF